MQFTPAGETWWRKPLVIYDDHPMPAEVAVLRELLQDGEAGAWLNSKSGSTGVVDLMCYPDGRYSVVRAPLPGFVGERLLSFFNNEDVAKGVYDLVVWKEDGSGLRFVEVTSPEIDPITPEKKRFAELVAGQGIQTEVVEWEFEK